MFLDDVEPRVEIVDSEEEKSLDSEKSRSLHITTL